MIAPVPLLARLAAAAPPPSTVLMYDFPASAAEYLKAAKVDPLGDLALGIREMYFTDRKILRGDTQFCFEIVFPS